MTLILLVTGEPGLELSVGCLLGAVLIVLSTVILVGIVSLYHENSESILLRGRGGYSHPLPISRLFSAALRGWNAQRGTLLFISFGSAAAVRSIFPLSFYFPFLNSARAVDTGFMSVGLPVSVLPKTSLKQR